MRAMMFVVFGVLFASACGYADPISQSRTGGVLALTGDESIAMEEATKLMAAHCGRDNYEVTLIEEVVVDEEDYVRTETEYDAGHEDSGTEVTTEDEDGSVTTTTDAGTEGGHEFTEIRAGTDELIETHVSYRCIVPRSPSL